MPTPATASAIANSPLQARTPSLQSSAEGLGLPFTSYEVQDQLTRLHVNRSPAASGFPAEFLKGAWTMQPCHGRLVRHYTLLPALTALCNALLHSGRLPSALNTALLTPIHKRGDPMDLSNYSFILFF